MLIHRDRINKRDGIFAAVVLLGTVALILMPTKFHDANLPRTIQARARVLEVDNTDIQRFGIVKQGEQTVKIRILSGRFRGSTVTGHNALIGRMDIDKLFRPGDLALIGLDLTRDRKEIARANLIDHYRIHLEIILFALFCALLIGFAGWTGIKALISFVFTGILIWKVFLPVFLMGWNPILVSLGIVTVLTAVIIFLVGGLETKGLVAFLGAFSGVVFTCVFSLLFGAGFKIHGAVKPFSETLLYSGYPHLSLTQIFLAGIFIASAGAVMDIAMDISVAMKEVHDKYPAISLKELIFSGFNVGRAVIGTMTTTLLLAYSGGYTTMLMVFLAQGTPLVAIFNLTYISSEILHTLVGSFGLVLVAPLTAIIAGFIYFKTGTEKDLTDSLVASVEIIQRDPVLQRDPSRS
jgi:uncharacterized membrane protein